MFAFGITLVARNLIGGEEEMGLEHVCQRFMGWLRERVRVENTKIHASPFTKVNRVNEIQSRESSIFRLGRARAKPWHGIECEFDGTQHTSLGDADSRVMRNHGEKASKDQPSKSRDARFT